MLNRWSIDQFEISPGQATPVAPLVTISGVPTDHTPDTIMLADVYVQQLTVWTWLTAHLDHDVQIVPESELVSPGVPVSQLDAQGFLQMYQAKQAAEVEAFRTLGWSVPATSTGAAVWAVVAGSAASRAKIHVADEIVGVGGQPTTTACQVAQDVGRRPAGVPVTLTVRPVTISTSGALRWGREVARRVTPTAAPSGSSIDCGGTSLHPSSYLGVELGDFYSATLPATVNIDTADIGGPSAGLAMTLTLIDQLSPGSLTGHHRIAVTGTISLGGAVGQVGGVAQKTVAVERAGATVFLVPTAEAATARRASDGHLKVVGVSSLAQALAALRALGGVAPTRFG